MSSKSSTSLPRRTVTGRSPGFGRPMRPEVRMASGAGIRKAGRFTSVPLERVREYWDQRPCNVRHSLKPPGTREYFDEVEARRYFVEPHIPAFADFGRWVGKRVLEIGCGIGTDTIA